MVGTPPLEGGGGVSEYEINSDNEELISELDFESDNSSIYSLEDEIEEFF